LIFRHYCIQNVKDGILIQVYNNNKESVNHFSQFISVKVKKNLRKSQAQFREKLRKLRLRQNNDFLIKKNVYSKTFKSDPIANTDKQNYEIFPDISDKSAPI